MPPVRKSAKKSSTGGPKAAGANKDSQRSGSLSPPGMDGGSSSLVGDVVDVDAPSDGVIALNIGGSVITTLRSTLLSAPSNFRDWLTNDFNGFPRDASGRPFFDRDPNAFTHVLNYMRGYGLPDDTEAFPFLAEDAVYYQVHQLMKDLGVSTSGWHFLPGPGVSSSGLEFSTCSILGVCGTEPLSPLDHEHFITIRFEKAEKVEVGVVAGTSIREDATLSQQDRAIAYRNTGEILTKLSDEVRYRDSGMPRGETITVRVIFNQAAVKAAAAAAAAVGGGGGSGNQPAMHNEDATTLSMSVEGKNVSGRKTRGGGTKGSAGSASIVFEAGDQKFSVEWPAPIPPLFFAVGMSGASSVLIAASSPPPRQSD